MSDFSQLVGGLVFPEGLRWRTDRLWFTDVEGRRVYCCDGNGIVLVAFDTGVHPVGLGWDENGDLLISTLEQRVLRARRNSVIGEIDATDVVPANGNDLVSDERGHAYYGSVGAPMSDTAALGSSGSLVLVDTTTGGAYRVAEDLGFPNGMVLTDGGRRLLLAESVGRRITEFRVSDEGSLTDRRLFAALDTIPDGICLDAEGAVWIACPTTKEVIRVRDGGEVTTRLAVGRVVLDVELGGADGRTLYAGTAPDLNHARAGEGEPEGRIEQVRVDVPRADAAA